MCDDCLFYVQFPGVSSSDVIDSIAGITYPGSYKVTDLVNDNPQWYFEPGINGISTLCTIVNNPNTDLVIRIVSGGGSVPITGLFVKGRPVGR